MIAPALLLAALTATAEPVPAVQQQACFPTVAAAREFLEGYGETLVGAGAAHDLSTVSAVFANPATGSWTVLVSSPSITCIVDFGSGWKFAPRGEGL